MRAPHPAPASMGAPHARRVGWPLLALVLAGCTFTGLADYDTPECDPTLPYAQDPCATVDTGNVSCFRSQCDPATRRCAVRALDEDKDGDPPLACGGTDCDDHDPHRAGRLAEICDGIDNDCNAITDDGLLAPRSASPEKALTELREAGADLTLRAENGAGGRATYLGTALDCVREVTLGTGAEVDNGCTSIGMIGASTPRVRQPQLRTVGSAKDSTTIGIAFVAEGPCKSGSDQLGYFGGNGGGVLGDCGASLPALGSFPSSTSAVIAFYDAPVANRQDPIDGCASAAPALLKVRYVDGATGSAPDIQSSTPTTFDKAMATSTRPPVFAPVTGGAALLLASPFGTSAGLWSLTPDAVIVPLVTSIAALSGARSVAMTLRDDARSVAIVAEQGCKPSQSLTLATADFDPVHGVVGTFRKTVIVAGPVAVATAPAVAWSTSRKEWWVSWVDGRQKAQLVRVSDDGARASAALELGPASALTLAADSALPPGSSADPLAFLSRPGRAAIDAVAVSCPR